MCMKNTATAYGSVSKFFHWVIFLLVAIMLPLGFLMGDIADKATRSQVSNIHKLLGLLILLLMLMRLAWNIYNVKPQLPYQTPAWQRLSERVVHFLLYLSLIVMPLSGLVGSVSEGKAPHLGNINFIIPVPASKALSDFAFDDIHGPLAWVILVLISIHILAALYHHYIKRDDILRRMLPWNRR